MKIKNIFALISAILYLVLFALAAVACGAQEPVPSAPPSEMTTQFYEDSVA